MCNDPLLILQVFAVYNDQINRQSHSFFLLYSNFNYVLDTNFNTQATKSLTEELFLNLVNNFFTVLERIYVIRCIIRMNLINQTCMYITNSATKEWNAVYMNQL